MNPLSDMMSTGANRHNCRRQSTDKAFLSMPKNSFSSLNRHSIDLYVKEKKTEYNIIAIQLKTTKDSINLSRMMPHNQIKIPPLEWSDIVSV